MADELPDEMEVLELSDQALREISEVVRWKRAQQPLRRNRAPRPEAPSLTEPFINRSGVNIPWEGGVVWLKDGITSGTRETVGDRPQYPGIVRIGITTAPVAAAAQGRVYVKGSVCKVRVRAADWGLLASGSRIGASWNTFEAQKDDLGPMRLMGLLDSPYVWAEITGERGDCFFARKSDWNVYRPVYGIMLHTPLGGSETSPGYCTMTD